MQTAQRRCAHFVTAPPRDARLLQVTPPHVLGATLTTQDRAVLHADYELGRATAQQALRAIDAVLA